MRRSSITIASIAVTAFLAAAALANDAPSSRLSDDIALTKATIVLLAAKDFAAVRDQFDPKMGQVSDDTLNQMSDVIGAKEPPAIETISSKETHDVRTGDGSSRIFLEYGLAANKWVVVDAAIKTEGASKRFLRLFLTANTLPLKELNAFHLFGKGASQYLFLLAWIVVIALTALAMIIAFRQQTGWRRSGLVALMPLGLTPTVAMNWNSAHVWVLEATSNAAGFAVPIVSLRYPMALFSHTETYVPYLYISAPLIALGYLIWQLRRSKPAPMDA